MKNIKLILFVSSFIFPALVFSQNKTENKSKEKTTSVKRKNESSGQSNLAVSDAGASGSKGGKQSSREMKGSEMKKSDGKK